jgi:hypothetical protein
MITPDHEILSQQNGWIPVSLCAESEMIATMTPAGKLEYKPATLTTEELLDSELFFLRHNRAELSCKPETKLICKFSKTAAWQPMMCKNVKSLDFTLRLYLGEVTVKLINMKTIPGAYSGTVYSPVTSTGNYLVRKADKIMVVCC